MRGGREQLTVSFDILSRDRHGAVVLPVPALPTVTKAPEELFGYLERATRPAETVVKVSGDGDLATAGAPGGVRVIGNERIGAFQVVRLAGGSPRALDTWLTVHGYRLPPRARPILASYLRQGWSFVAVRLADRADGKLTPLRIAFASTVPIYPMRLDQLSRTPVSVDLYVVGDHRATVRGLSDFYAGRVGALDPPVPASLRASLDGAYLTRLNGSELSPASLTHDFVARRADSDASFRSEIVRYVRGAPDGGGGPSPWWLVVAAGAVGAVGLVLVRRRQGRRRRPAAGS